MKRFKSFILENVPMPKRSDSATDAEHSAKLKAWAAKERGEAIKQTEKAASRAATLDTTIKGLKATETVLDTGLKGAAYVVPGGAAVYGGLQVVKAGLDASRGDYQSAQDRLIDAAATGVGGKFGVGATKSLTKAGFGSFTSTMGGGLVGSEVGDLANKAIQSGISVIQQRTQSQPTLNTTPSQSSPIKATQTSTPSGAAAKNQSATSTATSATSVTNAPTIENERISSTSAPLDATVTGSIKLSRQANQYATSGPAGTGRNQSWKPGARMVAETWQEYNWKFGEDRKRAKQVLKKIRKHFNLPETMPGDE